MRLGWDTTFTNDSDNTGGGTGGGAIRSGGNMDLTDCTFDTNTSQSNGGAVFAKQAVSARTFSGCIFNANTAEISGGAVFEVDSTMALTYVNSLFTANTASGSATDEGGGAILNAGSTNVAYLNCTFVDNHAEESEGGGMRVAGGTVVATNCIFWDNCDAGSCGNQDESAQIHLASASATVTYTTLEGCDNLGFCAESTNKNTQPNFVNSGDHPYQLTSSNADLIDGGDGAESSHVPCPSVNATSLDLAGNTRFVYKTAQCGGSNANVADMGAYEVQ